MPPAKKSPAGQKGKKSPKAANDAVKKPAVATRRSRRLAAANDNVDGDAAAALAGPSGAAGTGVTAAAAGRATTRKPATSKKPAATRRSGRKPTADDNVDDDAAGTADPSGTGAADGTTGTAADTAAASVAAAPPAAGAMTRARRRAQEAVGGNVEDQQEDEQEEQLTPEDIARQEEEEERQHRAKKRSAARLNRATLPPLQSANNADAFYEGRARHVEQMRGEEAAQRQADKEKEAAEAAQAKADKEKAATEKAARPKQRLKLNVTKGPAKVSLTVGKRSEDSEAARLARIKDREERVALGESVTPSESSSLRSDAPSIPSSEESMNDPGPPPRDRRFLCGVEGCSGGAYDFTGFRSHYKSVHKGKGMPKSENNVRTANFLDWLNDRIDGNPATKQAKTQYSDWLGAYPDNESQGSADKENNPPEELLSDASSGTRKRRREEAEADGEGQAGKAPERKRKQRSGKSVYGDWPDEEEAFRKRMAQLRKEGRAFQPTQGQNLVDQDYLEEMQRIRDEQEDQNTTLRKALRNNQLQLEAARRAGDYALYELSNAKERVRALEQIAGDNDVSLPKADDGAEYHKLLLEQAFGEEEPQFLAETQRWEWNLLQRRTYHIYRRQDQTDDEWDAEEDRANGWQEPTDMEIDTDAPHNPDEMTTEGFVFDADEMPPRPAYAVPQNNPDDHVSATGQEQEAETGRRLAYPQRRFVREWAIVEQILPKAAVPGYRPADYGQNAQRPADQPADENQLQESAQPAEENLQQEPNKSVEEVQEQNPDQPPEEGQVRQGTEDAPADDATTQEPQQGGFQPPVSRSETGKWTCNVM